MSINSVIAISSRRTFGLNVIFRKYNKGIKPLLGTFSVNPISFQFSQRSICTSCCSWANSETRKQRRVRRQQAYVMANRMSNLKPQFYDYFLILDFEATCKENEQIHPQEIIEFPVLKINSQTLETEATFHHYVQPRVHKELTPFCTKLTGIMQAMVDNQPHIEEVLEKFDKWMVDNKLLEPDVNVLFVTCGDWDLMKMLPKQASNFHLNVPKYFKEWLNIKKAFAEVTSSYPKGMMPMLSGLNLSHLGRHHSGIDDCKNIGNILCELLNRGYVAKVSGYRR